MGNIELARLRGANTALKSGQATLPLLLEQLPGLLGSLFSGAGAGLPSVLLGAQTGSDTTGARGTLRPYRTIQKAIDSASSGDTIWVFPGAYPESVVYPLTGVNSLTIQGIGALNTVAWAPGAPGGTCLTVQPTTPLQALSISRLTVRNMSFSVSGASKCLVVDSSTISSSNLFAGGLVIDSCSFVRILGGDLIQINNAGDVTFRNVSIPSAGGDCVFKNMSRFVLDG